MGGSGGLLFEIFRYTLCKDQDDFLRIYRYLIHEE